MSESTPKYESAADAVATWRESVLTGKADPLYPIGRGELERVEIGPKRVTLIGGPPGAGKTAFSMQATIDALRLTPTLRACVCNIEMSAGVLLDRQLARLSGIDLTTISKRRLGAEHADRLDQAMQTLEAIADRLCFIRPPFDLANVAAVADAVSADLIVLDYIQRIRPPGEHGDKRCSVDATMDFIRQFADAGVGVLVIAAVSRTKDKRGRSSYDADGLNLASFRESSELEFGADDAYILTPPDQNGLATLRHLKARHADPRDIVLNFDRPLQRFTPVEAPDGPDSGKLKTALAAAWGRTATAADDEDDV